MNSLLERLKERKLVQWALTYLAGAWLVLQVLGELNDAYNWPSAVMRSVPVLLGVGLFAALVLAWYHGEKGQQRVSGPEVLMLSALLAVAGGVSWLVSNGSTEAHEPATAQAAPESTGFALASTAAPERSIAVLPFADLSEKRDQEYFSDGLTEELLNALAKVPGLQVAARTSSFQFKGESPDVRDVGEKLGVAHVLEGSVRKSGDRLKITAQLVHVENGYQLWSETYERRLEDIFTIQEEISRAIVSTLQPRLAGTLDSPVVVQRTHDVQAYNLYLKGRYHFNRRSGEDAEKALKYFEEAIARDSTFAAAHAGLADAYALLPYYGRAKPQDVIGPAKAAARRAIELDPTLPDPHSTLGWIADAFERDWATAEREFEQALRLNPNHTNALHFYSLFLSRTLGRFGEGIALAERAVAVEPLAPVAHAGAGAVFHHARQYNRAIAAFKSALALDSTYHIATEMLANTYIAAGRYDEALATLRHPAISSEARLVGICYVYAISGRRAEARQACDEARRANLSSFGRAKMHGVLGERDRAFKWLEKALEERSPAASRMKTDPLLDPLRGDPRFARLLERLNLL